MSYELMDDIEDAEYELSQLLILQSGVSDYNESIALSEAFILETQSEYRTEIRAEDLIMYVVELQQNIGIETSGISFNQPVNMMTVQALVQNERGDYRFENRNAYRIGINMNVSLTYQQLKELVDYVYNETPKTSLHSVSLSYNSSTGLLHGSLVINKHFISGYDEDYVAAQIPDMSIGLPNPFGIVTATQPPVIVTEPPVEPNESDNENDETV